MSIWLPADDPFFNATQVGTVFKFSAVGQWFALRVGDGFETRHSRAQTPTPCAHAARSIYAAVISTVPVAPRHSPIRLRTRV